MFDYVEGPLLKMIKHVFRGFSQFNRLKNIESEYRLYRHSV